MPNISDLKTENVGNVRSFTETLTNLRSGTLYYVRAYVKVEEQVYYGGVITVKNFTTSFYVWKSNFCCYK